MKAATTGPVAAAEVSHENGRAVSFLGRRKKRQINSRKIDGEVAEGWVARPQQGKHDDRTAYDVGQGENVGLG